MYFVIFAHANGLLAPCVRTHVNPAPCHPIKRLPKTLIQEDMTFLLLTYYFSSACVTKTYVTSVQCSRKVWFWPASCEQYYYQCKISPHLIKLNIIWKCWQTVFEWNFIMDNNWTSICILSIHNKAKVIWFSHLIENI